MNEAKKLAVATKTINKANTIIGPESIGFKRYMALPKRVALSLKITHYAEGLPSNSFVNRISNLFGSMQESDFRVWILANI